jgi:putative spermidine/putrescine transport system substrate-binding protein
MLRTTGIAVCALTLAVGAAACGGSGKSGSNSGTTTTSGGSLKGKTLTFTIFDTTQEPQFNRAWVKPLEAQTGVKIAYDAPTDYAKLQAQVQNHNVSWDVIEADPWWTEGNCGTLLQPITVTVPNLPSTLSSGRCGLSGDTWAFLYMYNGKQFKTNPPTTWNDFFDTTKYPGKRAVWGSYALNGVLEGALLADGVSPDHLYPLDVKRAINKLKTIKSSLVFYDQAGQAVQMMESGNAAMVAATTSQGYNQAEAGGSFKPVWNQALLSWDAYIVPKGADMATASALLKKIASAEGQSVFAATGGNGVTNPAAKPKQSVLQQVWSPSGSIDGKSNQAQTIPFGQSYYAKNSNSVIQAWTAFVSG